VFIKIEILSAVWAVFILIFFPPHYAAGFLLERNKMHLTLIKNPDESKIIHYKLARIIYAETNASSLPAVEALASMIRNYCVASKRALGDIATDRFIFESLDENSVRHPHLLVDISIPEFQMCLRVVSRMLRGELRDSCFHAIRFHRDDVLPSWAVNVGSICEIDGLSFYL
jgi:hypothetical protein